jgi:hypothetical protein
VPVRVPSFISGPIPAHGTLNRTPPDVRDDGGVSAVSPSAEVKGIHMWIAGRQISG